MTETKPSGRKLLLITTELCAMIAISAMFWYAIGVVP